jgi:hypothetical protein
MRPASVFLNQQLTDLQRRRSLFEGNIFIFSSPKSCGVLCEHAMSTLRSVFETDHPETAYLELPLEEFVRRTETVKNRFTNGLRSKEILRDYAKETGSNPEEYYFDVPRIRIVPNYDYLHCGVSYAYAAHRDTWYGNPQYQINHWLPVTPVTPDQAMAIYPAYFDRPVKNSSDKFDLDRWINVERPNAVKSLTKEERVHPLPLEEIDVEAEIRFAGNAGDTLVFSGAHLHATVPNRTSITRFSIDFRFCHVEDIRTNGAGEIPAPANVDCRATGSSLSSLFHLGDFSPFGQRELAR